MPSISLRKANSCGLMDNMLQEWQGKACHQQLRVYQVARLAVRPALMEQTCSRERRYSDAIGNGAANVNLLQRHVLCLSRLFLPHRF